MLLVGDAIGDRILLKGHMIRGRSLLRLGPPLLGGNRVWRGWHVRGLRRCEALEVGPVGLEQVCCVLLATTSTVFEVDLLRHMIYR